MKKGKESGGVQIFLLVYRFVWRQQFQKKLAIWSEYVFKENFMVQVSWLEEFR